MTDHEGRSDPIETQLQAWARAELRAAPTVVFPSALRNQRVRSRRRPPRRLWAVATAVVVAAAIVAGLVLRGNDAPAAQHRQSLPGPSLTTSLSPSAPATDTSPTPRHTGSSKPSTVAPSPPAPPFGYCGGLRSVADARYITTGGAAVALVSAEVTGPGSRIPHVPVERNMPVSEVHLLAGHLPDGPLTNIDASRLSTGRYLIVVGDTGGGGYFPALGFYGVYAIVGTHAYRTCYDFSGKPAHPVTAGITTIRGLTRLFAAALRTTS